jgi:hypothetical protein
MWNAIKSDLFEFVSTVSEDTTKHVNKVLGEVDDEEEDESLKLQEKVIADLKRSFESYGNPIKESNQKDYAKYLKKFDMGDFGGYIADVLDEQPEVSRFYAELVPIKITPDEFWSRLFFRIKLITCEGAATFAEDDDDDEELVWEEDNGNSQKANPDEPGGGASQASAIVAYKRRITELETENAKLKSHVKTLAGRVEELEAAQKEQMSKSPLSTDPTYGSSERIEHTTGEPSTVSASLGTDHTDHLAKQESPMHIGHSRDRAPSSSVSVVSVHNESPAYSDSDSGSRSSGVVVKNNDWMESDRSTPVTKVAGKEGTNFTPSSTSSTATAASGEAALVSLDDDEDDDWN